MVRRVSLSQFQSEMRRLQQQQRRAVDDYNRKARAHNAAVDKAKREVRRAVDDYNREARAYNARLRANRSRYESALRRFSGSQPTRSRTPAQITYRSSVQVVSSAYVTLERRANAGHYDDRYNESLDLAEREAANAVQLANALESDEADEPSVETEDSLTDELSRINSDLADRWKGALFSLSPGNPDASRHFCTSARELIATLLDRFAPAADVIAAQPDCDRAPSGEPTRRAKITFMLARSGKDDDALGDFVDVDVDSVVSLFPVFNDGTHGSARKFTLQQLGHIRRRVQDSVQFILRVAA